MNTQMTIEEEREDQRIEEASNNEALARSESIEGARNCYLRGEIEGDELDRIVDENRD